MGKHPHSTCRFPPPLSVSRLRTSRSFYDRQGLDSWPHTTPLCTSVALRQLRIAGEAVLRQREKQLSCIRSTPLRLPRILHSVKPYLPPRSRANVGSSSNAQSPQAARRGSWSSSYTGVRQVGFPLGTGSDPGSITMISRGSSTEVAKLVRLLDRIAGGSTPLPWAVSVVNASLETLSALPTGTEGLSTLPPSDERIVGLGCSVTGPPATDACCERSCEIETILKPHATWRSSR